MERVDFDLRSWSLALRDDVSSILRIYAKIESTGTEYIEKWRYGGMGVIVKRLKRG